MLRLLSRPAVITPQTPDEELVARVQRAPNGDSAAFRALFDRHVVSVRRFLRDLLRADPSSVDDATQETFTRAHVQMSKLVDGRFKPWVLGIARNVAFEARRVRVHQSLSGAPDTLEADADDAVPDAVIPSPNPETAVLDRELERHFGEALEHLQPQRRAALLMRVDHGLSYEDIAAATGWSLPTVKNEIHRARLKLRSLLQPHLGGMS